MSPIFGLFALLVIGFTVLSIRRDARWMGNAALVIVSLLCLEALIVSGAGATTPLVVQLEIGVLVLSPVLVLVLAGFLLRNGLQMIRKEGRSLANLMSLLAGLALIALEVLAIAVIVVQLPQFTALAMFAMLVAAYLGLELVAFMLYSFVYSLVVRRRRVDYVIALGSGLKDGRRVTPLLAGRVDRAIKVYSEQLAAGGRVKLLVSGGRGDDEHVSEAAAMREYALEKGIEATDVLVEEKSTNTEQNLLFSREVMAADFNRALPSGPRRGGGSTAVSPGAVEGSQRHPSTGAATVSPAVHLDQRGQGGQAGHGIEVSTDRTGPSQGSPGRPAARDDEGPAAMIVTSDYHAMRAATLARRLGLRADAVGARTARYYWPSAMLREFVAMLAQHKKRHAVLMTLFCVPLPILIALL